MMRVGVGYSENPDTTVAGIQAARDALTQAGRSEICDLVLLFSTAQHDAQLLRDAVADIVGRSVPIFGGGAVGTITNRYFGYAGNQVGLAAIWLDGVSCEVLTEGGLTEGEEKVGKRLGERLGELGTIHSSPVVLFYDAIDRTRGDMRLIMATPLLEGLGQSLGFFPDLVGAGLQGDYACSPSKQWTGTGIAEHNALALKFGGDVRVDSIILHGCRPVTDYYTVTKADKQTLLEINGQPALSFVNGILGSSISQSEYAFFLIFGVNKGDKWGDFDEKSYVNRLCLAIDKERNGITMFEPDMVEGTEFQIMYRSFDLDYIAPKIENLFDQLDGRKPVFALYIDCAGRAAGYSGTDLEDAIVIQKIVADRAPLLGLYTGVEIASVEGRPRGLDWTGVFCLFSVSS